MNMSKMKINTLASVKNEISSIDMSTIEDILNTMRRKSGLLENEAIPPIHIRRWTRAELIQSILNKRHIPIGMTCDNPETVLQEVHIMIPPIWKI
jgi:hypothetical protein